MIDSSGGVPPGGGSGSEPPQGPAPTGDADQPEPMPTGKTHKWGTLQLDSKQWRMTNMLMIQQFQSVMKPLWANERKALKRLGKDDPYADD